MKEHPMIFSTESVKAILNGRKTQTMRVIKPQPPETILRPMMLAKDSASPSGYSFISDEYDDILLKCPYGQVGDRLWVRETWRVESFLEGEPMLFGYKDGQTMEENEYSDTNEYESWNERVCIQSTEDAEKAFKQGLVRQGVDGVYRWDIGKSPCRWRPSIFIPRWASRITLEITDIRVKRLQEISYNNLVREGIEDTFPVLALYGTVFVPALYSNIFKETITKFSQRWDSLNAKRGQWRRWEDSEGKIHREFVKVDYSWATNPWVWAISFKRSNNVA